MTIEQQDWLRFLTSDGLAEKAGCPPSDFDKMVVKEFADNAADIGGFGYEVDEDAKAVSIWNGGEGLSGLDCLTSAAVGCHGVLRNSVATVLIAAAHALTSHSYGLFYVCIGHVFCYSVPVCCAVFISISISKIPPHVSHYIILY